MFRQYPDSNENAVALIKARIDMLNKRAEEHDETAARWEKQAAEARCKAKEDRHAAARHIADLEKLERSPLCEVYRADTVADEVYDTAAPQEADNACSRAYTGMPAIDVRMNCIGLVINREDISQNQIVQKANELAQYVLYGPAPESILGGLLVSGRAYGSADAEFPC